MAAKVSDDGSDSYLPQCPFDVRRWFDSDTFLSGDPAVHGAYLNLCFAAFRRQPYCVLPDDDLLLSRLSGCLNVEQWLTLRERVLRNFEVVPGGLRNPVVLETYTLAMARFQSYVSAGRIGGKASAHVRRARAKGQQLQLDGTTVERPLNDRSSKEIRDKRRIDGTGEAVIVPAPSLEQEPSRSVIGADAPGVPDSWSGRFCADWKETVSGDAGVVPGGKIGFCLRNLVAKLGEERVRPVWQHYLRAEPRPAPRFFAENFVKWEAAAKTGRGIFERPSLADRNAAVGADWEREMREGRR